MPPANELPALDRTLLPAPRAARSLARHGVTLIELLVVLVLMALSAAVVYPAVLGARVDKERFALESVAPDADRLIADKTLDPVFTAARRIAIHRGEPLRMRVAPDGVYAVISVESGASLANGQLEAPLTWLPDVAVDVMGTCTFASPVHPPRHAIAWDALACRWRRERAP